MTGKRATVALIEAGQPTVAPAPAPSRATLAKEPAEVARMFDGVARRYDLTNSVLSGGQDRRWRRKVRDYLNPRPGERVLDVAAGTGVSTLALSRTGAYVVAVDFSVGMLQAGRAHAKRSGLPYVAADALHLPFRDCSFDAVTISFGLRNIANVAAALAEFRRVTKPGGRLLVCEFSHPVFSPFRKLYLGYLTRVLPWLAGRVSSNPQAYSYLSETIRSWPTQRELLWMIHDAGWEQVYFKNLTGGIVALHWAERPAE